MSKKQTALWAPQQNVVRMKIPKTFEFDKNTEEWERREGLWKPQWQQINITKNYPFEGGEVPMHVTQTPAALANSFISIKFCFEFSSWL